MTPKPDNGIVTISSHQPVDQTVQKLEDISVIDHSGEAEKAGMRMPPTKLVIFGNPKAGTPLMNASPSIAIDLPLKLLVGESADGQVWISYNAPAYPQTRHRLPPDLLKNIAAIEELAAKAAE